MVVSIYICLIYIYADFLVNTCAEYTYICLLITNCFAVHACKRYCGSSAVAAWAGWRTLWRAGAPAAGGHGN